MIRAFVLSLLASLLCGVACSEALNPVVAPKDELDPRCHSEPGWYWCGDGDPGCCFATDTCAWGECRYDGHQDPVRSFGASADAGERPAHSARRYVP